MRSLAHRLLVSVALAAGLGACESAERDLIRDLPADETYHSGSLEKEAHVVRTEANIPHIYASTRHDAAYVLGFTTARDRFFMMDLARRLGTGRVSELLGDGGLSSDLLARLSGVTYVADRIAPQLDTELADHIDAYVAGVNDYITDVKAGKFPLPSELAIAGPLLGFANPSDLMSPFERRDICAIVAVTIYESSFETGDIGRSATAAAISSAFAGAKDEAFRKAGLDLDLYSPEVPLFPVSSAPGLGTSYGTHADAPSTPYALVSRSHAVPSVSFAMLERATAAADAMQIRFHRDKWVGYGSNAWAVAGYATANGNAVAAGDGHLALSIPSVLFEFGLDTAVFGDGDLHQLGMTIPGFPIMALGTNGKVAWSQTQLGEDVTDWYREIIQLDSSGVPTASKWGDQWMPITRIDESFTIADVPVLSSVGRVEVHTRYQTFDGRWFDDWEGRKFKTGDTLAAGESVADGLSGPIVPGDEDGDGEITAMSFSYAGLYADHLLSATDGLGHAGSVDDFREATKGLVAYSQNFAVADASGNILYTSYEPVPCRSNLPRNPDGTFVDGANPTRLLDGTKYGAWTIPIKNDKVDESVGASDPSACVVPFDKTPQSINPNKGFVATANNDPGGMSFDNSVYNDAVYLGGPWEQGWRADTISRSLAKEIGENRASVDGMAEVQANVDSRLGELFTPYVLLAIEHAKHAGNSESDQRLLSVYARDAGAFDEIATRLAVWRDHGYQARSGVKTFYKNPSDIEVTDAVSTMIFNAWMRQFRGRVFDDEPIQGILNGLGQEVQARALDQMLVARGDNGGSLLASWMPDRKESVFFDDLNTPDVVETSDELIMLALVDTLAALRSAPTSPGVGGFGTPDMTQWLWGLRHQVVFRSLIADYLPKQDAAQFSFITDQLQISTTQLPLAPPGETIDPGDPRADLVWFPRDGDQWSVNASNFGINNTAKDQFTYGSGPVMRMVFELSPSGVVGQNVMPGGQSGLTDSPNYKDQLRLWLANRAYPMRFDASAVAAGATRHEVFLPD